MNPSDDSSPAEQALIETCRLLLSGWSEKGQPNAQIIGNLVTNLIERNENEKTKFEDFKFREAERIRNKPRLPVMLPAGPSYSTGETIDKTYQYQPGMADYARLLLPHFERLLREKQDRRYRNKELRVTRKCLKRLLTAEPWELARWDCFMPPFIAFTALGHFVRNALDIRFLDQDMEVAIGLSEIIRADKSPDHALCRNINRIHKTWYPNCRPLDLPFPGLPADIPTRPEGKRSARGNELARGRGSGLKVPLRQFKKIEGLKWNDVSIEFVSDDSFRVRAKGQSEIFMFAEAGFKDGRKGNLPDRRWEALVDLAEGSKTELNDSHGHTKKAACDIRRRLKSLLQISDYDPIPYDRKRKRYIIAFSLQDCREGQS